MKLPMASGLEDDELGVEVDDGGAVAAASHRFSAPSLDRIRVRMVGIVAATNLVSRATNPTSLFYMALRDGGPPTSLGRTPPIRA